MPIYVVGARAQRVRIPNQALSITVTGSVTGAALDIRAGAQTVVRSSDHHAVLPQIDAPLVVALIPRGAARFAPGTVVHLAIAHDTPTVADPVQVVFDPVDISGEAVVVFAELTPQGPDIEVAASALADTPMNPLAAAARSVARATVGRGRPARATPVVLACDTSASMRQWFADGSVAAAADIVVGVADALGLGAVNAVLVGAEVTAVPQPPTPDGLATMLRQAAPRWSAGARWSKLAPGPARVIVCSDYVPTQVRQRFPVIAVSADQHLDPAARLPAPPPGQDATAALLAHPATLQRVVAAVVRDLS